MQLAFPPTGFVGVGTGDGVGPGVGGGEDVCSGVTEGFGFRVISRFLQASTDQL